MTFTSSGKRHHVLIDLENATGTASPKAEWALLVRETLTEVLGLSGGELVTVASAHRAARTTAFYWNGSRLLWQSGVDGADLALLEVIENEPVTRTCAKVTIVSGDGIFAGPLAGLSAAGVETTVVSIQGHLARRSRLAAHNVIELEPWPWVASHQGVA